MHAISMPRGKMMKLVILLIVITIASCVSTESRMLANTTLNEGQLISDAERFVEFMREKEGFSGSILIRRAGADIFKKSVGYADHSETIPITGETRIRIASLTKQFTAVGVLRLAQANEISLNDLVCKHVAYFCIDKFNTITIHHLLSHTSGLPRISQDRELWDKMGQSKTPVVEYVKLAIKQKLEFEPGTRNRYSNFGYRVLSHLIEIITERKFDGYMKSLIFDKADLNNSAIENTVMIPQEVADGLVFDRWDSHNNKPIYLTDESERVYGTGYGSGGAYSSVDDLAKWSSSLNNFVILDRQWTAKLFAPNLKHYAYGWKVKRSSINNKIYQTHNGASPAYFSEMWRIPEEDLLIIVLGNVQLSNELDEILYEFIKMARGLPYSSPWD